MGINLCTATDCQSFDDRPYVILDEELLEYLEMLSEFPSLQALSELDPYGDAMLCSDLANARAGGPCLPDSLFDACGNARPAKRLALRPGPCQASLHAILDHRALKLGEDAHHLEHGLAGGRARIDALLMEIQIALESVQFAEKAHQILEAASQAINGPRRHHVKAPTRRVLAKAIEGGPLVATLRAAHAVVLVDLDNLPIAPLADKFHLPALVFRGLAVSRNPEIDRYPFGHGLILPVVVALLQPRRGCAKKQMFFDTTRKQPERRGNRRAIRAEFTGVF